MKDKRGLTPFFFFPRRGIMGRERKKYETDNKRQIHQQTAYPS